MNDIEFEWEDTENGYFLVMTVDGAVLSFTLDEGKQMVQDILGCMKEINHHMGE